MHFGFGFAGIGWPEVVSPARLVPRETDPTVSVIMIFLDAVEFIAEAIDSVLAQTFDRWELILVDDGSRDGSSKLAERYAASHPERIRMLRHPGGGWLGTGPSRALGVSAARGRHIAFLDADDVFERGRLVAHVDALQRDPSLVMVQSLLVYWHSWRSGASDVLEPPVFRDEATVIMPPGMLLLMVGTAGARVPGVCSVTARADAVRAVGGFEADFNGAYEDQVLWMKLYLYGNVLCLNRYLARYRQHAQSLTQRASIAGVYTPGRAHLVRKQLFLWLRACLLEKNVRNLMLERWVAQEIAANEPGAPGSFPQSWGRGLKQWILSISPSLLRTCLLTAGRAMKRHRTKRRVAQIAAAVFRDYGVAQDRPDRH